MVLTAFTERWFYKDENTCWAEELSLFEEVPPGAHLLRLLVSAAQYDVKPVKNDSHIEHTLKWHTGFPERSQVYYWKPFGWLTLTLQSALLPATALATVTLWKRHRHKARGHQSIAAQRHVLQKCPMMRGRDFVPVHHQGPRDEGGSVKLSPRTWFLHAGPTPRMSQNRTLDWKLGL